jgi:hypothetical protein
MPSIQTAITQTMTSVRRREVSGRIFDAEIGRARMNRLARSSLESHAGFDRAAAPPRMNWECSKTDVSRVPPLVQGEAAQSFSVSINR